MIIEKLKELLGELSSYKKRYNDAAMKCDEISKELKEAEALVEQCLALIRG